MAVVRQSWRLVLVCLVAYAWVIHGFGSWNSESHLALTYAIVDGHTLAIDKYATELGDRATVGEHFYTDKLPAESFLAVPAYALLRTFLQPVAANYGDIERVLVGYILTLLVVGLPAALGVGLLHGELVRTGASRRAATLAALAYGLGSILWPFSTWYYSHALAATCVLATWVFARRGQARALIPAALAMMCEAPVIVPVAPALLMGACIWWRERRAIHWPGVMLAAAIAAVPILATALYATAVYGAPWRLGYEHLAGPEVFRTGMSGGVMGVGLPRLDVLIAMLIEPYRGLLVANPVLVLAVPAAIVAIRRRLVWEGAMLATFVGFFIVMSGYAFWDGGGSIGPRHVLSALPLVFLASGRVYRGALAHALTALSIALMLLAMNAGSIFMDTVRNPWLEAIVPAALGRGWTDLTLLNLTLGATGLWSWAPVILAIALVWPVPPTWVASFFVQLPVPGDNTEAGNQHYAITWWKRSDRRGDRARGAHVLHRLAVCRPGNANAAD